MNSQEDCKVSESAPWTGTINKAVLGPWGKPMCVLKQWIVKSNAKSNRTMLGFVRREGSGGAQNDSMSSGKVGFTRYKHIHSQMKDKLGKERHSVLVVQYCEWLILPRNVAEELSEWTWPLTCQILEESLYC